MSKLGETQGRKGSNLKGKWIPMVVELLMKKFRIILNAKGTNPMVDRPLVFLFLG